MNPNFKRILAVLGGLIVGMISIGLIEGLGHLIFPPPTWFWLAILGFVPAVLMGFKVVQQNRV